MKIERNFEYNDVDWGRHLICPVCGNRYEFKNPSATISFEVPNLGTKSMSTIIGLNSDWTDLTPGSTAIDRVLVDGCGFYCSHHSHPVKMILAENDHLEFLAELFMRLGFTIKDIKCAYLENDDRHDVYHVYYFKNLTDKQMDYLKFLYSTTDNPKDFRDPSQCHTQIEMFIKKDRGAAVFAARWSYVTNVTVGFGQRRESDLSSCEFDAMNKWYEKHPDDRESANQDDFATDRIFDFVPY